MLNKIILNSIFVFFVAFSVNAQKTKIETTKLSIEDNKLVIYYDILKSNKNQKFDIWVQITTSTGEKINASSFSGEYGNNIIGGQNKKIIWDYDKDGIVLNDNINVEIMAKMNITGINFGKAMFLSAIVPGLGLTKITNSKAYLIMGVISYAAAAISIVENNSAAQHYDSYVNTDFKSTSDMRREYDAAKSAYENSYIAAYSAIGIWTINMVWTAIKAKKTDKSMAQVINKKKTIFYSYIDPKFKTLGFTFRYNF